jgi:hypothetical protein
MNATTKTPLIVAFAVVAVLFVLFGIGAMTVTMMNAGWMGSGFMNGNGMTLAPARSAGVGDGWRGGISGMGGMSWMWIPTLLTLGLGALLGWVAFGKKA